MKIKTVGIITYQYPHLKTEQVLQRLLLLDYIYKVYALPFTPRAQRNTLFQHRPNQIDAVDPETICEKHGLFYVKCSDDKAIDNSCDVYLILGSGIMSAECIKGKKIVNCHPGIIPASRGLDSFKWALCDMQPLGVTLHYIDSKVDSGEIISVIPTNVYVSDSLATLARRHYENEIDCLSRFDYFLNAPSNPFEGIKKGDAKKRMPLGTERELARKFDDYTRLFGE